MKYLYFQIILLFIVLGAMIGSAQSDGYLIQLKEDPSSELIKQLDTRGIYLTKKIFDLPLIYLAHSKFRNQKINSTHVARLSQVEYVQENRPAELRNTEPNDPLFNDMWHLQQINASAAWDFATSGMTADGDSIVLGIFDSGYEMDHPDLAPNFWKNPAEIPNDGIDNDNNGYTDDYFGVNFSTQTDEHSRESHGTEVAGVIAAAGNNDLGITGVTWNSKLLLMSKSIGGLFEADFIESYNYVIEQRKLYNASNGNEGAFVVAVNLSIGIPKAKAEDYPMWCGVYDEIGRHGILGICATDNDDYNVDELGDMPTTCPSPYIISVTASDRQDDLMRFTAYGEVHIDLAAPGDDILSTALGRNYTMNSGTSLAAPQVTGAVALAYMAANEELLALIKSNPSSAALEIRNMILSTVKKSDGLAGMVASGGRLDLGAAVEAAREYLIEPAPEALALTDLYPTFATNFVTVELEIPSAAPTTITVLDMRMGRTVALYTESNNLIVGSNIYQLPVSGLAAGGYLIVVEHGGEEVRRKFLVGG